MKKRDFFPSGKNSRPGGGGANRNFFASCLIPLGLTHKRGERGFKGGFLGAKFLGGNPITIGGGKHLGGGIYPPKSVCNTHCKGNPTAIGGGNFFWGGELSPPKGVWNKPCITL